MAVSLGSLAVDLQLQAQSFTRGINQVNTRMGNVGQSVDRLRGQFRSFQQVAVGAFAAIAGGISIKKIIDNTIRQENAMRQLEQRLVSTGGAAGVTSKELTTLASELQQVTTFGDEAVIEMEALLLTFTNIKGGVFREATRTILDMSVAMDQGLKQSAIQVGKALNDPIRGVTALREVGIQFSDSQIDVIKSLAKTGQMAKAQNLILSELQVEFGGAAAAARDTLGGALDGLQNSFGDLLEAKGGLTEAKNGIEAFSRALSDPKIIASANNITTTIIKGFGLAAKGVALVADGFQGLKILFTGLGILGQQIRQQLLIELKRIFTPLREVLEFLGKEHTLSLEIDKDFVESRQIVARLKQDLLELTEAEKPSERLNKILRELKEEAAALAEQSKKAANEVSLLGGAFGLTEENIALTTNELIRFNNEQNDTANATGNAAGSVERLTISFDRLTRETQAYIDANVLAKLRAEETKEQIGLTVFELIDLNRELEENAQLTTLATGEMLQFSGALDGVGDSLDLTTNEIILLSGEMGRIGDVSGKAADETKESFREMDENARELTRSINRSFQGMFRDLRTKGFKGFFDSILDGFGRMLDSMLAAWATSGIMKLLQAGGFINAGAGGEAGGSGIPGFGGFNFSGGISSALQNAGVEGIVAQKVADGVVTGAQGFAAGMIGRDLSSALFGSKGLGADIGGAAGGGIGFGIGSIFGAGPVGAGIGSFLGSAIGGLFGGGAPEGKINLRTSDEDAGFKNAISADSPFGFVGADEEFSRSLKKIAPDFNKRMASLVAGFDAKVATFLSDTQTKAVGEALREAPEFTEDVGKKLDSTEFGRVLANRAINILEGLDAQVPQILRDAVAGADLEPEEVGDILTKALLPAMEGLSEEARKLIRNFEGTAEEAVKFAGEIATLNQKLPQLKTIFGDQSLETLSGAVEEVGGMGRFNQLTQGVVERFGLEEEVAQAQLKQATKSANEAFAEVGTSAETFAKDFEAAMGKDLTGPMLAAWLEAAEALGLLEESEKNLTDAREAGTKAAKEARDVARQERLEKQNFEGLLAAEMISDPIERQVAMENLAFERKWQRRFERAEETGADMFLVWDAYNLAQEKHKEKIEKIRDGAEEGVKNAEATVDAVNRMNQQTMTQARLFQRLASSRSSRNLKGVRNQAQIRDIIGSVRGGLGDNDTQDSVISEFTQRMNQTQQRFDEVIATRAPFNQFLDKGLIGQDPRDLLEGPRDLTLESELRRSGTSLRHLAAQLEDFDSVIQSIVSGDLAPEMARLQLEQKDRIATLKELGATTAQINQVEALHGQEREQLAKELSETTNEVTEVSTEAEEALAKLVSTLGDDLKPGIDTVTARFEQQRQALIELISTSDDIRLITESLAGLKTAAQQVFAVIEQTRNQIQSVTQQSLNQIKLTNLGVEGQFNFFRDQATRLREEIGQLSSPEAISQQIRDINQLTLRAFGLIEPSQQKDLGDQFSAFLSETRDESKKRLDEVSQQTEARLKSAGDRIADQFGSAIGPFLEATERFSTAVDKLERAVTKMDGAANKQQEAADKSSATSSAVGF